MITREVNDWIKKVETGQYSYSDAMERFVDFSKYLTKEEILRIKRVLENCRNSL